MSNTEPTLIALLRANGYSVKNPCVDIQGVHFHCSLVRMHTSVDAPSGGDSITVFASSPNAWDMIGGTKMISKELGEKFVQRVHGLAPPMTMMDLSPSGKTIPSDDVTRNKQGWDRSSERKSLRRKQASRWTSWGEKSIILRSNGQGHTFFFSSCAQPNNIRREKKAGEQNAKKAKKKKAGKRRTENLRR